MKKRVLALLLTVCMLLGAMSGFSTCVLAEEGAGDTAQKDTTVEGLGYDREHLSVATFTPLTGSFFTDMWGNGTSDADVKALLHGYPLAQYDVESQNYITNDDVVSGLQITKDSNGNRTYNIFLYDDLYYSDGSKITAYDYAFSILFQLSPALEETGADRPSFQYIIGAPAYANGKSETITGLRVISDNQLKITFNASAFPYYYELSYIAINPYPISVIAPGCEVVDSKQGVKLEGTFNASVVNKTVLNSKSGYLTYPKVVSGPYTLKSFDGTTAEFELNTYYKGSDKASIKTVTYTSVTAENAAETLQSGEVALVNKAMNSQAITSLTQLLGDGTYQMSSYPRTGLSFISFCCEQKTVSEEKVRQAIAMCLDKEAMKTATVGDYGTTVDGYYGIGQWMYKYAVGAEEYPTTDGVELAKWQKVTFDNVKTYDFDPEAAGTLLEKAGWKLNADGIRQKTISGKVVTLDLTLVVADSNSAAAFLQNDFTEALKTAGIKLTVKTMAWADMLKLYYREEERDCDMFYLASNFAEDFNPSSWFSTKDSDQGVANKTGINDETLYQAARKLVKTEPTDMVGYCVKWIDFVETMAEVMPVIPVYSNIYFDYYTGALTGYEPSAHLSWADGIYDISLEDITQ